MVKTRRAKIIATIGPASSDPQILRGLIQAGVNICRINMSHGTQDAHAAVICNIRNISTELNKTVGILLDLQGPKIRVDKLAQELKLQAEEEWVIGPTKLLDKYPEFRSRFIPTIYEKLVEDAQVGERVLFDDGLITGQVVEEIHELLKIKIAVGGTLKSNKGINLPDTKVSAPCLTEKDKQDLDFGLKQGVDFVALSFVRTPEDIIEIKNIIKQHNLITPVIAKIEKPEALCVIDEILQVVDGIMIARGDMAVEIGNHKVPSIQKNLINKCNKLGLPVITATQMMESMIVNPTPTRAEASDVANAIEDGTDLVMLSAETAAGKYPIETVKMMDKIILEIEQHLDWKRFTFDENVHGMLESALLAATNMAREIGAARILVVTKSGHSAKLISHFRPEAPVIGITPIQQSMNRMSLYWGVSAILVKDEQASALRIEQQVIDRVAQEEKLQKGDKLVIVRNDSAFFNTDNSNTVRILALN